MRRSPALTQRHPFGHESLTVRQICERLDLSESTVRTRLERGQPLDRPYGVHPLRTWFCGEYLTRKVIAQRLGLSRKAVDDRVRRGKPLEDPRYTNRRSRAP